MNPFFEYLLKSTISLALFYIVFKLAVSRDKMFVINRFVLLGILIASAFIPFIDIPIIQEAEVIPSVEIIREFVTTPVFNTAPNVTENIQPIHQTKSISVNPYLIFYLIIISALFIRLLISVFRVQKIINGAEKQSFQKVILAVVKDFIQPFSFLKHIVICEKDYNDNREIVVAHEYAHIQHLHAIDLIVCELFTALHWFNPFMWFLRRDLKLIHEFQADQAVLNNGIDAKKYQLLVLQKSVGERRFALANNFTQKPILKRIKMMQKKNRKQWNGVKLILFIPIVLLLLQAFAKPELFVEKASEFVPSMIQKDSTEVWLDNWTIENLKNINGGLATKEFEIAPPPPGYPKSGLPKYDKSRDGHPIPTANILTILVNRKNMILASGIKVNKDELLEGVIEFLNGNKAFAPLKKGPEIVEKNLPFVGDVKVSKGVIILRYDIETKEEFIDKLLLEIGKLHLEARENLATEKFNQNYFSLPEDKKNVINQMLPVRVSIMEPKTVKPPPPPPPNSFSCTLSKSGEVIFGQNKYSISEFGKKLEEHKEERTELYKKWGMNPPLVAKINVEEGVSETQIKLLKEVLREAKIQYVNYSSLDKQKSSSIEESPDQTYPQNLSSYDIVIHKDGLEVKNEKCSIGELQERVEEILKNEGSKQNISVLSFTSVPEERVKEVMEELNDIPYIKFSKTILELTSPLFQSSVDGQNNTNTKIQTQVLPVHKILLKENGTIILNNEKYSLTEFEKKLQQLTTNADNILYQEYTINAEFDIENNASYLQVETVKDLLRKANINQVPFKIQHHSSRSSMPGTDIGQPTNVYAVSFSGELKNRNLENIRKGAENFLKKPNSSLCANILVCDENTEEDIAAIKKELLEVGFTQIDIR